ncbi:hypothetical protein, partial [Undibacterium sp.]|uniref:hypothetical protein n=1 Tax=Undibacterium sp. TaxID=1914977 RepID=UPI00374D0E1C
FVVHAAGSGRHGHLKANESFHKNLVRTTDFLLGWYVKKLWAWDMTPAADAEVVLPLTIVVNIA